MGVQVPPPAPHIHQGKVGETFMEIKQDSVKGLKHSYSVVVKPEAIEMRVKKKLQNIGKTAKIQGFRPGKAPMQVLQQRYDSQVRPDALREIIDESFNKILKDKKLHPATKPEIIVEKYEVNKALECKYEFEVLPEIKEIDLKKKVKIDKLITEVSEKDIEETLKKIAETNKTTEPSKKDRAAKKGDTVIIDFDGKTKNGPISGGSGKGINLELGSGYFIPGFEDQVIGMKKGDKKTVKVSFPKDYSAKDLAGLDATFECELQEVHDTVTPKMDDEFCKKIGLKDLKDLKKTVKEQLVEENNRMSFLVAKRDILDALEGEKVELPESLVDSELQQITPQNAAANDPDEKSKKPSKKDQDELKAIAERRVKLGLVLADIGNRNKIQVTEKEVQYAIIDQARRYPGQEKEVFDYFRTNAAAQQSLRAPIFEDKVIDFVISKATVKEKKVSKEALEKAAREVMEATE